MLTSLGLWSHINPLLSYKPKHRLALEPSDRLIQGIPDRLYYLIFRQADHSKLPLLWSLLHRLFFWGDAKDWSHVDIFYVDHVDHVTFIATAPWQVGILETGLTLDDMLASMKEDSTALIEFKSRTVSDGCLPRGLLSCVCLVKSILGLRGAMVWRPKHIFNELKNKGGKILWVLPKYL